MYAELKALKAQDDENYKALMQAFKKRSESREALMQAFSTHENQLAEHEPVYGLDESDRVGLGVLHALDDIQPEDPSDAFHGLMRVAKMLLRGMGQAQSERETATACSYLRGKTPPWPPQKEERAMITLAAPR